MKKLLPLSLCAAFAISISPSSQANILSGIIGMKVCDYFHQAGDEPWEHYAQKIVMGDTCPAIDYPVVLPGITPHHTHEITESIPSPTVFPFIFKPKKHDPSDPLCKIKIDPGSTNPGEV